MATELSACSCDGAVTCGCACHDGANYHDIDRTVTFTGDPVRALAQVVVRAWERLGRCEAEFGPIEDNRGACDEYQMALNTAIYNLDQVLKD